VNNSETNQKNKQENCFVEPFLHYKELFAQWMLKVVHETIVANKQPLFLRVYMLKYHLKCCKCILTSILW